MSSSRLRKKAQDVKRGKKSPVVSLEDEEVSSVEEKPAPKKAALRKARKPVAQVKAPVTLRVSENAVAESTKAQQTQFVGSAKEAQAIRRDDEKSARLAADTASALRLDAEIVDATLALPPAKPSIAKGKLKRKPAKKIAFAVPVTSAQEAPTVVPESDNASRIAASVRDALDTTTPLEIPQADQQQDVVATDLVIAPKSIDAVVRDPAALEAANTLPSDPTKMGSWMLDNFRTAKQDSGSKKWQVAGLAVDDDTAKKVNAERTEYLQAGVQLTEALGALTQQAAAPVKVPTANDPDHFEKSLFASFQGLDGVIATSKTAAAAGAKTVERMLANLKKNALGGKKGSEQWLSMVNYLEHILGGKKKVSAPVARVFQEEDTRVFRQERHLSYCEFYSTAGPHASLREGIAQLRVAEPFRIISLPHQISTGSSATKGDTVTLCFDVVELHAAVARARVLEGLSKELSEEERAALHQERESDWMLRVAVPNPAGQQVSAYADHANFSSDEVHAIESWYLGYLNLQALVKARKFTPQQLQELYELGRELLPSDLLDLDEGVAHPSRPDEPDKVEVKSTGLFGAIARIASKVWTKTTTAFQSAWNYVRTHPLMLHVTVFVGDILRALLVAVYTYFLLGGANVGPVILELASKMIFDSFLQRFIGVVWNLFAGLEAPVLIEAESGLVYYLAQIPVIGPKLSALAGCVSALSGSLWLKGAAVAGVAIGIGLLGITPLGATALGSWLISWVGTAATTAMSAWFVKHAIAELWTGIVGRVKAAFLDKADPTGQFAALRGVYLVGTGQPWSWHDLAPLTKQLLLWLPTLLCGTLTRQSSRSRFICDKTVGLLQRLLGTFFVSHLMMDLVLDLVVFGVASAVANPFTDKTWHATAPMSWIFGHSWLRHLFEYKFAQPPAFAIDQANAEAVKDPKAVLKRIFSKEQQALDAAVMVEIDAAKKKSLALEGVETITEEQRQQVVEIQTRANTRKLLGDDIDKVLVAAATPVKATAQHALKATELDEQVPLVNELLNANDEMKRAEKVLKVSEPVDLALLAVLKHKTADIHNVFQNKDFDALARTADYVTGLSKKYEALQSEVSAADDKYRGLSAFAWTSDRRAARDARAALIAERDAVGRDVLKWKPPGWQELGTKPDTAGAVARAQSAYDAKSQWTWDTFLTGNFGEAEALVKAQRAHQRAQET